MTFVIGPECIDRQDGSCVDVCPVDCIYEGERKNYINPAECIDCGACEIVCPELAIFADRSIRADPQRAEFREDNARFFEFPLRGSSVPLGNPGGARKVGPLNADTEIVATWPQD